MGRICIAAIYKLDFPEGMPLMEYDKIIERAVQKSAEEILKTVLGTDMPITSQMIDSAESHAGPEDEDHNGSYTKMIDDDNCVLPGHDNTSAELEPKIIDLEGDDNNVI